MRSQRRPRARALALAVPTVLLSGLGLAACGGDEDTAPTTSAGTSPEAGESAGTGDGTEGAVDAAEGEPVGTEELVAIMRTAYEEATTADLTMTTSAGGQDIEATGQVDLTREPVAMQLDMEGLTGVGDVSVVLVDGSMYLRLPQRDEAWVRLDLDDPSNPLGSGLTDQLDPRAQAEVLERGLQEASYLGAEDVDGDQLDHYRALVDSQALLEGMDVPGGAAGVLPETVVYDLWFDEEGRFRRMQVDLGEAAGAVEVRFDDWGTDVSIQAPPPGQVTDMGDLGGATGSLQG